MDIQLSKPQKEIVTSRYPLNLMLCGVGSGKTHTMAYVSYGYVNNFPNGVGLICANTYQQLSRSVLKSIFNIWQRDLGLVEGIHYVYNIQPPNHFEISGARLATYDNTISFCNGHIIWTASLDNYKVLDGIEIDYACIDETKDTKPEAVVEVIIPRLRRKSMYINGDNLSATKHEGFKSFNPLYVFTSPAKVQWLNELFLINENIDEINKHIFSETDYYIGVHGGNMKVVVSSTYHNKHNLPDNYIENQISILQHTDGLVDMLIYGSPVAKTGGEWWSRFDREKHVKKLQVNPDLPLHVTFDFNVNPYMPALTIQIETVEERLKVKVLKEYALKSPRNLSIEICKEVIFDYGGLINFIYYYGDPSGRARNTATIDKSIRHNYDAIRKGFQGYVMKESNRVDVRHPPMSGRRILANMLLSGSTHVDIEIDPSCVEFINDLTYLIEDGDGSYKKPKTKDTLTGITYEKRGHFADAFIYFLWRNFYKLAELRGAG